MSRQGWFYNNKGFGVLFGLYILAFILDLSTTLLNGDMVRLLETNPIYAMTGSLWPIVLANFLVIYFLWRFYTSAKRNRQYRTTFWLMGVMLFIVLIRIFVSYNAVQLSQTEFTPEDLQYLEQRTSEEKQALYMSVILPFIFPLFFSMLVFWFWYADHQPKDNGRD